MGKLYLKQIEVASISAGSTATGEWTADRDYKLRYIYVKEYTATEIGTRFLNCTFRLNGYVFTLDEVRGEMFDVPRNQNIPIDADFPKGRTFYYSITNEHSSSAIQPYIVLELEEVAS